MTYFDRKRPARRGSLLRGLLICLLVGMAGAAQATVVTVAALSNSSALGAGSGASTGIFLTLGDAFSVSVDEDDLWSAGVLPRWSNADGLDGPLFATGSDESGQAAGTLIGQNFGFHTAFGLSEHFGTLVGSIGGQFFSIGTSFDGTAISTGELLLHYWDSNAADNADAVAANIDVNVSVPAPAAFLLVLLAGLVTLRRRSA